MTDEEAVNGNELKEADKGPGNVETDEHEEDEQKEESECHQFWISLKLQNTVNSY